MSERQLRDEVLTTLFGGYEATADGLAWTWHLLARHPQAAARFRAELDAVVTGQTPTGEEPARMDYTRRLIMESMRLYPPFWWILRSAHGDDVVGGTRIPAGATVPLSPGARRGAAGGVPGRGVAAGAPRRVDAPAAGALGSRGGGGRLMGS